MAVRGVRPSTDDVRAVLQDPDALETLAREWVADPRFGETVRDMHAEQLLVRIDTRQHLPPSGPLKGTSASMRIASLDEEPLRLVEHLVTIGRPYTEIVTSPLTMADPIVAIAHGVEIDRSVDDWQEGTWIDGRPPAGILSSTTLWQRFMSSDTNHHRARANLVLSTLLCDPLPQGNVAGNPLNPDVATDPACAGCHQRLDPVGGALWGFRRYVLPSEVNDAYAGGCPPQVDGASNPFCYPIRMWDDVLVDDREGFDLPEPALDGLPVTDLADLGRAIAADPRFATCTTRRFAGYLTQTPPLDVPDAQVDAWTRVLVDSGWDARELVLAIVLDPSFAPTGTVLPQLVRPEQLDRMMTDLTGWSWRALPPGSYGPVGFATSDEYGYRTLLGGMNGWDTIVPDHHPMPTRELATAWYAQEAADHAVDEGELLSRGPVTDEDGVRDTLAALHLRLLAEPYADLGPSTRLFRATLDRTGDPVHAWKVVVTALLLDQRLVTY